MATSTVNQQKLKSVASELDNIYATMTANQKKLDELMGQLPKVWTGEGAQSYQKSYTSHARDFVLLAEAIRNCSATITAAASTYGKADMAAADVIKSKLRR